MLKLIQILQKKTYKLMWQEYHWCHLNNIINKCLNTFYLFIGNTIVCKTHIVSITN